MVLKYQEEVRRAMHYLAENEKTLFIGQTVEYGGSRFTKDLQSLPLMKRIEFPVAEELQMGFSIGLGLEGYIPVSIYPRFDFLLLATNQLVNHLDKFPALSSYQLNPKIILRTIVGSKKPFYPGPQHCQDHTNAFKSMLENVYVKRLDSAEEVFPEYKAALEREGSSLLIEVADLYT